MIEDRRWGVWTRRVVARIAGERDDGVLIAHMRALRGVSIRRGKTVQVKVAEPIRPVLVFVNAGRRHE